MTSITRDRPIVAKKLTGRRCECGRCGQRFNSTSAFDLHRAGTHGVDRHCREPGEMIAIGMTRTATGFWAEKGRKEWPENDRQLAQETRSAAAGTRVAGR
jgi:hypothetical protein